MAAFLVRSLALHQRGTQRQFVRRQPHRFTRILMRHAFHFKQDLPWFHNRDPVIGCALALTHTSFSRLLGDRLVGEYANPDLSATLHKTGHGHAAGLDLAVGHPSRLEHLQPVIPERQRRSAPCLAGHAPALLFPILHFLWHQHNESSCRDAARNVSLSPHTSLPISAGDVASYVSTNSLNPPTAARCAFRFFFCRK